MFADDLAARVAPFNRWTRDRGELAFWAALVILTLLTVVVAAQPQLHGHLLAPAADLALDTAAAIIGLCLAVLGWIRFGERRDAIGLYHAAAFLALAVGYATAVLVSIRDGSTGPLDNPVQAQVNVFAVARLLAAVLLILGATTMQRRPTPRHPAWLVLLPAGIVLLVAVAGMGGGIMPGEPFALVRPALAPDGLPSITPFGVAFQLVLAGLFLVAALVCRSLALRDRVVMDLWIAVALVFAAFGELHWLLYPSGHPGQISTGDLLRLAAFVALLVGVEAEARATVGGLRRANAELRRLRAAEADQAALEERARIARELHDGLAQDLWLAKLKIGQALAEPAVAAPVATLLTDAEGAIDVGLVEARQAVLALRISSSSEDGLCGLLRRYVDDFTERFAIRVELRCDDDGSPVAARTQAEVLRIAQEALTNVRHHAAASIVGMRLRVHGDRLELRVADNGRGFAPGGVPDGRFGLDSMRERARLIGGQLTIASSPGKGTTVALTAPVNAVPDAAQQDSQEGGG